VILALFWVLPGRDCGSEKPEPPPVAAAATPLPTPAPDLFASTVRPVLVTKCAPCHEPGGKLYEKLPFDNAGVVAAHAPGILRRLKGEDRAAVEKWMASLPQKNPAP
jgi:hypothetical protein